MSRLSRPNHRGPFTTPGSSSGCTEVGSGSVPVTKTTNSYVFPIPQGPDFPPPPPTSKVVAQSERQRFTDTRHRDSESVYRDVNRDLQKRKEKSREGGLDRLRGNDRGTGVGGKDGECKTKSVRVLDGGVRSGNRPASTKPPTSHTLLPRHLGLRTRPLPRNFKLRPFKTCTPSWFLLPCLLTPGSRVVRTVRVPSHRIDPHSRSLTPDLSPVGFGDVGGPSDSQKSTIR